MRGEPTTSPGSRLSFRLAARRAIFSTKSDPPLPDCELQAVRDWAPDLARRRTPEIAALAASYGFPGRADLLSLGTFHAVHRIDCIAAPPVVVRSTLPGLIDQDRGMLLDAWVGHWMARAGPPVPKVHVVRFESEGAPFDLAIVDLAEGTPLRDLGDALLDHDPDVASAIGAVLRQTHQVEGSGAGLIDVTDARAGEQPHGVHQQFSSHIDVCLDDHIKACVKKGLIDKELARKIEQLFRRMRPALSDRPMRLLHGDLGIHNICYDPARKRVTALLDWEDSLVGDPLFDVAMWSSFQPPRRLPPFLSGYGLSNPTLEEQRLIALYFLRIALSKTVHRLRFGVLDQPGRTPGHHRIYRGVEELEQLLGTETV